MTAAIDKRALRDELVRKLGAMVATARAAHAAAIEGATHGEARAENDKDTRGLEQSYIARGQATRVVELENAIAVIEAMDVAPVAATSQVVSGALVTVDDDAADGVPVRYFIASHGGGIGLANGSVQVITPTSPLGQAICGRRVDDDFELRLPGGALRSLRIDAIF